MGAPLKEALLGSVVISLVIASLPICFRRPWAGAMLWGWLGFLYPSRLAEARAFGAYFFWLVTAVTLAGVVANDRVHRLPRSRELYLLLALWAFCGLTTAAVAIYPGGAWPYFRQFTWIVGVAVFTMALSLERRRLMALLYVTAVPLGLYAVAGAAWVLFTGGKEPLYGPRSADIWNNNDLGATLVAIVPLLAFLGRHAPSVWSKRGMTVLLGASVVAILGTYSRASALALALILVLLAICRQWRAVVVAAAAFAVFMLFTTPATWLNRVDTIRTYRQEPSASMRPGEWYVAFRLGLDHPLLGSGFRPFSNEVYRRYIPDSDDNRDAHNMFLQVFAEHGVVGLGLYLALIASTFATLHRTARLAASEAGDAWLPDSARALQISLAGYIFDGMFHCLSYRAFFIQLLALSIMIDTVAHSPAHAAQPLAVQRWLAQALRRTGIRLRLDPPERA